MSSLVISRDFVLPLRYYGTVRALLAWIKLNIYVSTLKTVERVLLQRSCNVVFMY